MKIVEMHPEDLLDKDAEGELTESERVMLDAHLTRCATCRFEREVRADFRSELSGTDDEELSSQRLAALFEADLGEDEDVQVDEAKIEEALAANNIVLPTVAAKKVAVGDEGQADEEEIEKQPLSLSARQRRARRAVRIVMLVAAALLIGSAATASGAGAGVWARIAAVWSDPETLDQGAEPRTASTQSSKAAAAALAAPPPPPPSVDVITPTDVAEPMTPPDAIVPVVATAPTPTPAVTPIALAESPASLFDSANEARRQGDYARAITLSHRLQHQFPSSREAHTSHATVGRLLLDRGDAVGALASFDAYQAHGTGALDEAVMVGRATALDRLGRSDEARNAWRALLSTFPETPYAEHAHSRIGGSTTPSPMH